MKALVCLLGGLISANAYGESVFETLKNHVIVNQRVAETKSGELIKSKMNVWDAKERKKSETGYHFARLKSLSAKELGDLKIDGNYLEAMGTQSKYYQVVIGYSGFGNALGRSVGLEAEIRIIRVDGDGFVYLIKRGTELYRG